MSRVQTATKTESSNGNTKQRPANEIRLGRIKAVAWLNDGDNGPWYNVQIRRLYKDEDNWESADSFGRDDLPLVAKVADMMHTWCYEQAKS